MPGIGARRFARLTRVSACNACRPSFGPQPPVANAWHASAPALSRMADPGQALPSSATRRDRRPCGHTGPSPPRAVVSRRRLNSPGGAGSAPPCRFRRVAAGRDAMSRPALRGPGALAEFALISAVGFLIAYLYVAEFFRQYAAALALRRVRRRHVVPGLGLYNIPRCPRRIASCPACCWAGPQRWRCCWPAVFFLKVGARVLARLAGAVVRARRRRAASAAARSSPR